MAFGMSPFSPLGNNIFLKARSEACLSRATGLFGLAPIKAWQAGRAADSLNIRNLPDCTFSISVRIVTARYGLAPLAFPLGNCAQFTRAESIATERTVPFAVGCYVYMRTGREISGRGRRPGCGDGDRVRQNFIRWPQRPA